MNAHRIRRSQKLLTFLTLLFFNLSQLALAAPGGVTSTSLRKMQQGTEIAGLEQALQQVGQSNRLLRAGLEQTSVVAEEGELELVERAKRVIADHRIVRRVEQEQGDAALVP